MLPVYLVHPPPALVTELRIKAVRRPVRRSILLDPVVVELDDAHADDLSVGSRRRLQLPRYLRYKTRRGRRFAVWQRGLEDAAVRGVRAQVEVQLRQLRAGLGASCQRCRVFPKSALQEIGLPGGVEDCGHGLDVGLRCKRDLHGHQDPVTAIDFEAIRSGADSMEFNVL